MLPGAPRQTEHKQSTRHLWLRDGKTAEPALLPTVVGIVPAQGDSEDYKLLMRQMVAADAGK